MDVDVPLNAVSVAASATEVSNAFTLSHLSSSFALYYEITGDGDIDFFYHVSLDGQNFVKITESIKRGLTKTSGPASDGKGVLHVAVIPCNAIKIEAENTDSSNAATVTAKILQRAGQFGDFPVYDGATNATRTISYPHHEVHGGSAYWAANNATIDNTEVNTVSITTPDTTKWAHLLLCIDATTTGTFEVLEDVTSLSGGSAFTAMNFNRNSSKTSGMTVTTGDTTGTDPITPTGGTTIWSETLGTRGIATTRENASELVLKQNSIYLFRVTSSANSNNCTILLTWYEHTDR